jgi:hypothetical protein
MRKSEPKMILNVQIDNQELEKKVKIAMDKYAEDLILKNLDDKITRIVVERINRLVRGDSWSEDGKIGGKSLQAYVREQSDAVIEETIQKHIKDVFAKKLAELL